MKNIIRNLLYNYQYMIKEYSFHEFVETVISKIKDEHTSDDITRRTKEDENYSSDNGS